VIDGTELGAKIYGAELGATSAATSARTRQRDPLLGAMVLAPSSVTLAPRLWRRAKGPKPVIVPSKAKYEISL
jgi:hypothetical protein